ncbi:DUF4118 domain-containing protein [Streptomyces sp. NPDC090112]|uniref:DUF4118 domain-containing protein n=1 Tax=Streptomyces sp. NPDC090112 TaxID=3365949 RepID=UPI003812F503
MSGYRLHDGAALVAALVAPFLVALALVPFRTSLTAANAALVMVVVVVAVAASGTRAAGALAALSAAAWYDFFLIEPYQRFTIADGGDLGTSVLLLAAGLIVSQLAVRARRMRDVAASGSAHLATLRAAARFAEDSPSPEALVEHVRVELIGLLGLRGCRFEAGSGAGPRPHMQHDGGLWLDDGGRLVEYVTWPDGETELPVVGAGRSRGRFLLDPFPDRPVPAEEDRLVAVALAALAGAALGSAGLSRKG